MNFCGRSKVEPLHFFGIKKRQFFTSTPIKIDGFSFFSSNSLAMKSNWGILMNIKVPFGGVAGLGRDFIIDGDKNQGALGWGRRNFLDSSRVRPLVNRVLRTSFVDKGDGSIFLV